MERTCRLIAVLVLAVAAFPAPAQKPVSAQIDGVFSAYTKPGTPGCSVSVTDKGRVVHQKGYGLANLELGAAIDPATTVFDAGSLGKIFTAMSVTLLAQEGRLDLDAGVRRYLPELPPAYEPVTLRHLLHHSGGTGDYSGELLFGGVNFEDVSGNDEAMRTIMRRDALNFRPGERYEYSNSGYFLLGRVVEKVSGKTLAQFEKERIFAPLGMTHTRILDDHAAVVPGRATSYSPDGQGAYLLASSNWDQTGDGALLTTAEDMGKWASGFGSPAVGGKGLVQEMQTRARRNDGSRMNIARAMWMDDYRGLPTAASYGSWAAFKAGQIRFPEQDVAIITLCNVADADVEALNKRVADVYLAALLKPLPEAGPARPVPPDALGTYANLQEGVVGKIAERDGKLRYTGSYWSDGELVSGEDGAYLIDGQDWARLSFTEGTPRGAVLTQEGTVFDLARVAEADSTPQALSEFEGTYASPRLDTSWTMQVQDGQLTFRDKRRSPIPLTPLTSDAFEGPYGMVLLFSRDASRRIDGFTLAMQRLGRIAFVRSVAPPR